MQEKKQREKQPALVAKAALLFGSGTLSSRILGLIRDALLYSILPLDMKDAWIAAFRLPNFFRRLLGEGGLSVSFIPIFVESQKKSSAEQRALMNGVFTLLMSVAGLICLLSVVFMDLIIPWWLGGNGFTSVPGKIEMTIIMAKIMVGFLFFVTLFAYFMALLNGVKKFTLTGFAPVGLNICIIAGLFFYKDSPNLAQASAWSVLVGGALQAFILLPLIFKSALIPKFQLLKVSHPLVLKVLRKFLPTFFGVGVLQVLAMVNVYFASQLDSGALTYIYLGDRLLELPLSLIAVSIGTTLLPTLSEYWAQGDTKLFKDCVEKHFRLFYFLAVPAAFGLWFIGSDIIEVLFVRGEFRAQEVPVVASILQVYCLTLLCAGSLKIFNQSFYAAQDTLTPALISCCGLVIHIIIAPKLMDALGIQGLVLSTALITLLNLIVSLLFLSRRIGNLNWFKIFPHFFKCVIAASFMGGYLYFLSKFSWKQGRFILDFPILLALIAIGGLIYFSVTFAFKVDEMSLLLRRFRKKL